MKEKKNRQKFEHNPPRPSQHYPHVTIPAVSFLLKVVLCITLNLHLLRKIDSLNAIHAVCSKMKRTRHLMPRGRHN